MTYMSPVPSAVIPSPSPSSSIDRRRSSASLSASPGTRIQRMHRAAMARSGTVATAAFCLLIMALAGRLAAPWVAAGHENQKGNRFRAIVVLKLEASLMLINLFIWHQMMQFFDGERGVKRYAERTAKTRAAQVLLVIMACNHLMYAFYYVQGWIPALLWEFVNFFAGVWTNLFGFCCGFFLVNCTVWLMEQWQPSRRLVHFLARPEFIRRLIFERQAQIKFDRSLTALQLSVCIVAALSLIMYYGSDKLVVRHVTFPVPYLSSTAGMPLRFAVVSDIHAGASVYESQVAKMVDEVLQQKVDALLVVGDMVDGEVTDVVKRIAPLFAVPNFMPVFMVTGNHDYYYGDVREWVRLYQAKGITVLRNNHSMFKGICLAGVNDISSGKMGIPDHDMNATEALAGCPRNASKLLLAHNPASIKEFSRDVLRQVDVVLSGHTHAGQFYVVVPVVYWLLPYFYGPYDIGTHGHLFVTAGTFYQGPPMKMVGASQIWIVTLEPA